jgi:polyisoprenyl-phosphate glycosyltransferase
MTPLLSVVIPAFNEEQNIAHVYSAVRAALAGLGSFEVIFVDDGSSDGTAESVRRLYATGNPARLIRFGRNFGQQAALLAGIEAAKGSAVITMDCDLQHPPELLPKMVAAWRGGARLVQMVRRETADAGWFKRGSSRLFYLLINAVSDTPVTPGASDYQLLDASVVQAVLQFRDRQPFLRGLVSWLGFPTTRLEYSAPARECGRSGYTVAKMLRLALSALTGLSSRPLRFALYLGAAAAAITLAYAAFAVAAMANGRTIPGWTSVIVIVTFLGAVQLISVGILGEYIGRIYEQSRGMPRFVVVETDDESNDEVVIRRDARTGAG